jgi:hypothetical protein
MAASGHAEGAMTDAAAEKPGDGHSHRRRRRSRGTRDARAKSGGASLLSRLGRRLSRGGKLAVCVGILGVAVATSAFVRWLEMPDAGTSPTLVSAVGFWPAVFVTVAALGVLALAEAIGYKRKRLWLTTLVLMVYLALHAATWHRAYLISHETAEPQIVGSFDSPSQVVAPTPMAIDIYILWLYTVGSLSVISTLVLMRKLVRWGTPSSGSSRERRSTPEAEHAETDATGATRTDGDLIESTHGLPAPREVELAKLDEVRLLPEPAPAPSTLFDEVARSDERPPAEPRPDAPASDDRPAPRPRKPMFE